jgi:hypothetical protein
MILVDVKPPVARDDGQLYPQLEMYRSCSKWEIMGFPHRFVCHGMPRDDIACHPTIASPMFAGAMLVVIPLESWIVTGHASYIHIIFPYHIAIPLTCWSNIILVRNIPNNSIIYYTLLVRSPYVICCNHIYPH